MKTAYLSISYSHHASLHPEIDAIRKLLLSHAIDLFVFVERYRFSAEQEKEMMQQAFADIDRADLLIAEVSHKAIGVGIEIGYAIGRDKPVIYLRNASAGHSTTAGGSAKHSIVYENTQDLSEKLGFVLSGL
jgi:nucleoside 2-deoxyribosyltransferase